MAPEVQIVDDYACTVGEGPLWHQEEQRLYWTDIPPGRLHRYDPASDSHEIMYEADEVIGGFTFQDDGSLLLFEAGGTVKVWCDGDVKTVVDHIPDEEGMRFNDVRADPAGRVFCGTMDDTDFSNGRFYRLDTDGTITKVLDSVQLPNGMHFTPDNRGMYFTETNTNTIYRFDYDENTGELSNQQVFARLSDDEGMYDGLTVDSEGRVWSALFGGGAIVCHAPDGTIDRRISVPAENITSLTFGGSDLRDIYITSATAGTDGSNPHAGALFQVASDVSGSVEFTSRVGL